ncbi:MAG: amidohydrolase family protein [Pseudomonadota bacterium]
MNRLTTLFATSVMVIGSIAAAEDLPIFDAHIHYSHDAVQLVPPQDVAQILRDAGVKKAMVSSSDDRGTQLLKAAAPDIIVPALRPYRRRGEIGTWMHDPSVIDYLQDRLDQFDYEAIGEFHAFGNDIQTEVIQTMISMARDRDLLLHHHGDREALDQIFDTWPEARVLWAHSGFDSPQEVANALKAHPRLWSDLAFRSDMARGGQVDDDWRAVFLAYPDRFMVGTDTFAPERWYYVGRHADFSRDWLSDLPDDVARQIAYENAEAMLASR